MLCSLTMAQESTRPFFISAEIGIGNGNSEFGYQVVEQAPGTEVASVASRTFTSNFVRSRLSLSLGYEYKSFSTGLVAIVGTQKSNNVENRVVRENGTSITNKGVQTWPKGKSYYGIFIEYNWKIADDIWFSPRIDFLKYSLPSDETFIADGAYVDNSLTFNDIFLDRNALGIGGKLKFFAREGQFFFMGFNYVKDSFSLSRDYIQETFTDFTFKQSQISIVVGYQFSL